MPERENSMTVEEILKLTVFDVRIVDDGKTVYTPFGRWNDDWYKREVLWIDANEEGVIIIGI